MGNRRMFSKKITDTDRFLDMPASAQNLYFHLNMHADDDGFLGNAKTIKRMVGASDDDLKLLVTKQFLIPFDDGVVVIKDWRIHNYIRSDRYRSTIYTDHKNSLQINENQQYELVSEQPKEVGMTDGIPSGNQNGYQMDTQVKLSQVKLGEVKLSQAKLSKGKLSKTRQDKTSRDQPEADSVPPESVKEVIDYLNQKAGTKYRATTAATKRLVGARLKEGFTVDDCKKVIDNKVADWLNDQKMKNYLRPNTLFQASKFESYLNEVPKKSWQQQEDERYKNPFDYER